MARVTTFVFSKRLISGAHRLALATAALWATAIIFNSPALARQTLEIEGRLAPNVEGQLRTLVQGAAPAGGDADSASAITGLLARLLRSEGYYAASVRADFDDDKATFTVSPGLRFGIGAINAATTPADAAAEAIALAASGLEIGQPLRAEAVITGEARALAALQDEGWPDAELLERQVVVDHDTASGVVTLKIQTGAFSLYGEMRTSSEDWRPDFITRLAPFEAGETAQLSALRRFQTRLSALEGVERADVRLAESDRNTGWRDVQVELTPAARHVLEAGFSFSTSEGGGVDGAWTRRNLFGGDEALTVSAQLSTLEQSLGAALSAPHWRRLDQTLGVHAAARSEETDAFDQQEIEAEVEVTRRLSPAWSGGVKLGFDLSRLSSSGQEADTATLSAGVSAVYDTRDNAIDAARGARGALQLSPALTMGDIESGYVIGEASLQSYRRLGASIVAAGRLRIGGITGAGVDSVPADDRFYAGGGGSVRGFDFQSLGPTDANGRPTGGRSVIEASAELRWRGPGRWGAAVFADAGIASPDATPDLADLRVGLGGGLRYHFDFAPLRLDIAAPLDRRSDEASLHVYIGLGQAF